MHEDLPLAEIQKEWHGSWFSYISGLVFSFLLTAGSFYFAWDRSIISGPALIFTIVGLGLIQAIAQLIFFLHLGKESKPRWELVIFCFMVMVLLIIVCGSLWIMYDLNHRVMGGM